MFTFLADLPDVLPFLLRVVDSVSAVQVHVFENVQDGENLAVVRDQGLANDVGVDDQMLEHFQRRADRRPATRVQRVFNRNDQLRNN